MFGLIERGHSKGNKGSIALMKVLLAEWEYKVDDEMEGEVK